MSDGDATAFAEFSSSLRWPPTGSPHDVVFCIAFFGVERSRIRRSTTVPRSSVHIYHWNIADGAKTVHPAQGILKHSFQRGTSQVPAARSGRLRAGFHIAQATLARSNRINKPKAYISPGTRLSRPGSHVS